MRVIIIAMLLMLMCIVSVTSAQPKHIEDFNKVKIVKIEDLSQNIEKRLEIAKKTAIKLIERHKNVIKRMHRLNESKKQEILRILNETYEKVNKSENYKEIRNAMRDLRIKFRLIAYEQALNAIERVVERLKQLRDRFEVFGLDVSDVDEKLKGIEEKLKTARNCLVNGDLNCVRDYIHELRSDIRNVVYELKRLAREFRVVYGYEIGIVHASVNGSFELSGDLKVALIRGVGNLNITPESAVVTEVTKDSWRKLVVKGSVDVVGNGEFRILAIGKGSLNLSGTGYYRVKYLNKTEEEVFNGNVLVVFGGG